MAQNFVRNEEKYLITRKQYHSLMEIISPYIERDLYSPYQINSLYYDTPDRELMTRNMDKPAYRQKIRMRSYGPAKKDDRVFLEMKKKLDSVTIKKRVEMPYGQAQEFTSQPSPGQGSTQKELCRLFENKKLIPIFGISYSRKAYVWKEDPEVRLTFDTQLKYRTDHLDLTYMEGKSMLDEDLVLMELKAPYSLPLKLVRALSACHIQPTSFSKASAAFLKECSSANKQ